MLRTLCEWDPDPGWRAAAAPWDGRQPLGVVLFLIMQREILPVSAPAWRNSLVPVLLPWQGAKAPPALPSWQGVPSLMLADARLLFGGKYVIE